VQVLGRHANAASTAIKPKLVDFSGDREPPAIPKGYLIGRQIFDVSVALAALPAVALVSLILLALNPIWNRGSLFYAQKRMGRGCRPFRALKFRTMVHCAEIARGPDDPLETERITRLGHFLRRTRIDEIPQFLNVLIRQMSVIGPRPDYWDHAIHYLDTVPGYRHRHSIRPGITGLAQVDGGYAEGIEATILKTRHDLRYLDTIGIRADWYVLRRTVAVVLSGWGAR
jgi:lipopolysaccharide/colanic/teichoic acid biosynthesis glycosyltransferase